jgi:hypothetical protein
VTIGRPRPERLRDAALSPARWLPTALAAVADRESPRRLQTVPRRAKRRRRHARIVPATSAPLALRLPRHRQRQRTGPTRYPWRLLFGSRKSRDRIVETRLSRAREEIAIPNAAITRINRLLVATCPSLRRLGERFREGRVTDVTRRTALLRILRTVETRPRPPKSSSSRRRDHAGHAAIAAGSRRRQVCWPQRRGSLSWRSTCRRILRWRSIPSTR